MDEKWLHLLEILEIVVIASIKFAVAPFIAEAQGFNFSESFVVTITGGIGGILCFTFIGDIIIYGWKRLISFFKKPSSSSKKKFTWTKKLIVRTRMKFGIAGIALITPSIISIPLGTFVIHRFYRKKWKNIFFLTGAVIFWGVVLNLAAQYLKVSKFILQ